VLPPLRDRKEDLPLLVEHFVREAEAENSAALRRTIEPEALEKLKEYDWPGNIRELRTCLFNAVNSHPDVEHLVPVHLQFPKDGEGASIRSTEDDHRILEEEGRGDGSPSLADTAAATSGPFVLRSSDRETLRNSLQDLQVVVATYLEAALRATADPVSGDPSPTKAFKLLTEEEAWGANPTAQGYDLFKRLLKLGPGDVEEALLADHSLLKQVYKKAREER
jgi:DNA-binding NtrC family response regulator